MSTGSSEAEQSLDPARVQDWMGEEPTLQVIDVREPYEHEAGHIEGTRLIELVNLTEQAASIDGDRPVIFYCRVGARSKMATQAFRAAGYEAYSMVGGLKRWAEEGRPLSPQGGSVADH